MTVSRISSSNSSSVTSSLASSCTRDVVATESVAKSTPTASKLRSRNLGFMSGSGFICVTKGLLL